MRLSTCTMKPNEKNLFKCSLFRKVIAEKKLRFYLWSDTLMTCENRQNILEMFLQDCSGSKTFEQLKTRFAWNYLSEYSYCRLA